ncbi:putative glycosyl transferase [Luteitalea pratensis]|uniref:Putative glycosyl transferase n=2 Tax=Luteitalea pratensis TaxID=1855912 RepID=A0A143PYS8_LUTPR|nr:putative glycosyl transferase [Luteitalea pratensis]
MSVTRGINETDDPRGIILSPIAGRTRQRVLYVDNYGGRAVWQKIKAGDLPPHHLRGCLELVRMGYEVVLPEPVTDFYFWRRPLPHDLVLLPIIRDWLGSDGIVFCGHNVLYWLLILKKIGIIKCHVVSHLWAREPLNLARWHSGIVALTPAGAQQAKLLAPRVNTVTLGWGATLDVYPRMPYRPETFFSCGIALRDFRTLSAAATVWGGPVTVVVPGEIDGVSWSPNVTVINSGQGWNFESKRLSYHELLNAYYRRSIASLLILREDPEEYTAVGFTELLEVLAMGRPLIMTRTGALPTQIDVEREGCGLFVPPGDPDALAIAMRRLADDPEGSARMARRSRELAESYYNINRYARELDTFFLSLG